MKTQAERLELARLGPPKRTKAAIAKAVGVSTPSVSDWFSGKTKEIEGKNLLKLSKFLNVRPEWLVSGIGPMRPTDIQNTPMTAETQQNYLVETVGLRGSVPLISWVQAGTWETVIDNLQPGEGQKIETTWKARSHTYALRVKGDSMEPKFPDGCIVIVEPEEEARHNSYVVVRQNGDECTLKQLVQDGSNYFLKPLNPRYPVMEMKRDAVICGVVKRVEMDV